MQSGDCVGRGSTVVGICVNVSEGTNSVKVGEGVNKRVSSAVLMVKSGVGERLGVREGLIMLSIV